MTNKAARAKKDDGASWQELGGMIERIDSAPIPIDPYRLRHPSEIVGALYERHAELWRATRRPDLIEKEYLDRFAKLIPQHGSVLDVGCGSGVPIASYLTDQGMEITGLDSLVSQLMV